MAVEIGCSCLIILGCCQTRTTVNSTTVTVAVERSYFGFSVSKVYELGSIDRFYEVTATWRGGGGKGLRGVTRSRAKFSVAQWAKSPSLSKGVEQLNRFVRINRTRPAHQTQSLSRRREGAVFTTEC